MDFIHPTRQDIDNFVQDGVVNQALVHEEMTDDKLAHMSLEDIDTRYRKFVFAYVIDGSLAVSARFEPLERIHRLLSDRPHGFVDENAARSGLFETEMFWMQAVLYLKATLPTLDDYILNGPVSKSGAELGLDSQDELDLRRHMENPLHKMIARYNVRQSMFDSFNRASSIGGPYMHFDVDLPAFSNPSAASTEYWRHLGFLKEQFDKSARIEMNTVRLVFYRAQSLMDLYRRDLIKPEYHDVVFQEIEAHKQHVRQCAARADALRHWMGRCDRLADCALG